MQKIILFCVAAGAFPGNSNAWFTLQVTSDQGAFSETLAVKIGNPYDYPPEIMNVGADLRVGDWSEPYTVALRPPSGWRVVEISPESGIRSSRFLPLRREPMP